MSVRLVRACGSKLYYAEQKGLGLGGQARKSLWIETLNELLSIIENAGSGS